MLYKAKNDKPLNNSRPNQTARIHSPGEYENSLKGTVGLSFTIKYENNKNCAIVELT